MKATKTSHAGRQRLIVLTAGIALVAVMVICLGLGRFSIPIGETAKIIVDGLGGLISRIFPVQLGLFQTWTDQMASVLLTVRLPRVVGAALVGAALALSGATYQGVFKNPLVSPDLLGVSNGACVGAAFAILFHMPSLGIQLGALAVGLLTVLITTTIPKLFRKRSSLMLVLSGVIVSGFMSAVLGMAKYAADPEEELPTIVYWMMGSLSGVRMRDILIVAPAMLIALIILLMLRWRVNLLSLGDTEAKSLGVNVKRVRGLTILCATVLTAGGVCICGTIGWVGLVVPHFARILIGQDNRCLMPLSAILGAVLLVLVDTIARNLTGSEIPLSIITGEVGAPLFLWLLTFHKARID